MKNDRYRGKNVVITGGSSGIGLSLAREFAAMGSHLFLLARSVERLEQAREALVTQFAGSRVMVFAVDVTDEAGLTSVINNIGTNHGGIDVLINNAGTSLYGRLEDHTAQELKAVFDINYFGALYGTYAALPYLKASKGQVAYVSSVAGYTGLIGYTSYAPTKFAIAGLAECLRMEFADYGIGVTVIYPPDTQTPMLEREQEQTLPESKALSGNAKALSAEKVAQKLVKGLLNNRFEVYCNGESTQIRWVKGLAPRLYYRIVDGIVRKDRKRRG